MSLQVRTGKKPDVTFGYTYKDNVMPCDDEYCDCDERCDKCGKKKKPRFHRIWM